MKSLISSSINKKKRCATFLFNYNKTKLSELLNTIGLTNGMMIIEETDGSVDYSSYFKILAIESKTADVYEVNKSDFDCLENLFLKDENVRATIVDLFNDECKDKYLTNPVLFNEKVFQSKIIRCLLDVNRFESEIFVGFTNIDIERFNKLKNIFTTGIK